ncbi:hypothetical protein ACJJTC_005236 [Scirpophaga incertulas]
MLLGEVGTNVEQCEQVSPEEVERVGSGARGVAQLVTPVLCQTTFNMGKLTGWSSAVVITERLRTTGVECSAGVRGVGIVQSVQSSVHVAAGTLSEHKRLAGGIAVVAERELPRTHTGKVHRARVQQLVARLLAERAAPPDARAS